MISMTVNVVGDGPLIMTSSEAVRRIAVAGLDPKQDAALAELVSQWLASEGALAGSAKPAADQDDLTPAEQQVIGTVTAAIKSFRPSS
jgi:hypothetical protein